MSEYKFTVIAMVERVKPASTSTQETNQPWSVTAAAKELLMRRNVRGKGNGKKSK